MKDYLNTVSEIQFWIMAAMSDRDKTRLSALLDFKRSFVVIPRDELFESTSKYNKSIKAVFKESRLRLLAISNICLLYTSPSPRDS